MELVTEPNSSGSSDIENVKTIIEAKKGEPKTLVMISLEGCPYCDEVRTLAPSSGYKLEEILITRANKEKFLNDLENNNYKILKQKTFPMCYIEGKLIGGCSDFKEFIKNKKPVIESKPAPEPKPKPIPPTTPKPKPSTSSPIKNARLEQGVLPKVSDMFSGRNLDFGPIAATVNSNMDPLFSDLKRCLCDGFADIFASISPLIIDRIVDSMKDSVKNDPKIQEYIQSRLIQLIDEIKSSPEKDMIITNLNGECKEVFTV